MAQRRIGIIMHGVTGRMGLQPASGPLDRGDPRAGRGRARQRRPADARSDPGRAQRRQGRGAGRGARHRALDDRPRRGAGQPGRHAVLRRRHDADARRAAGAGDRRRQARLLREAGRRPAWTSAVALARKAQAAGIKNGVVQDKLFLPGLRKLAMLRDSRLLRPHALGARRVRLLGVRGRLAAGAAAVLELPQGGRRRHHPRHALPLALRARQPVRRGAGGQLPRRDAYPGARSTRRAGPTPPTPTTPPTRPSSSRAACRADQLVLDDAGAARRPGDLPGRRHARLGGGRADASAGRSTG